MQNDYICKSKDYLLIPQSGRLVLHRRSSDWLTPTCWRFVYVVKGEGVYECSDGKTPVKPGDYLLLRPGPRRIEARSPIQIEFIPFRISDGMDPVPGQAALVRFEGSEYDLNALAHAFRDAALMLNNLTNPQRGILQLHVMLEIFIESLHFKNHHRRSNSPVVELASHLAACPEEHLTVPEMARRAGASVPHFNREFQKHFGTSPAAFAIRTRVDAACRLMESEEISVKETAYSLNYSSPYAFSRQFRNIMGYPPNLHREIAEKINLRQSIKKEKAIATPVRRRSVVPPDGHNSRRAP